MFGLWVEDFGALSYSKEGFLKYIFLHFSGKIIDQM